ncbi:MAG: riboflavin synthase, alpha subunit [Verrucomicrobiales bacterium]|nr:riboflavin synthase, alpha subunit [Verrucomicrobiales bacterium]
MFTGLVEEAGFVECILKSDGAIRLSVRALLCGAGCSRGDSISVNGCCLTVVDTITTPGVEGAVVSFELLQETWNLTNLQYAAKGDRVNLERALLASARLGGHFVSGHIDEMGTILKWEKSGSDHILEIGCSAQLLKYVVHKGSIALDGMSLTVASVFEGGFRVWIIPHTYEVTTLKERQLGDRVNLEPDLLAKYVEKLVAPMQQ